MNLIICEIMVSYKKEVKQITGEIIIWFFLSSWEGGVTGVAPPPPFQISKIKESNKTKQKIEDNTLEKEEEK